MPNVTFRLNGVNMTMPFEDGQAITCEGPLHHPVGQVVQGRKGWQFGWTQKHRPDVPIFDHVCTECNALVTFPRATARTF